MSKTAIIISISSDIGLALADRWLAQGWQVHGTFRSHAPALEALRQRGATLVQCDLADASAVDAASAELAAGAAGWDVLVVASGTTEPIGRFLDTDFDDWSRSLAVNFTQQLRFTHRLLPARDSQGGKGPCVLYFAGGGTNNATVNYSAYTISKIALIKMCELLDAEYPDTRFSIVGPGWVKTKIHDETLRAGALAGNNFERTKQMLDGGAFTPMERVLDCCDWIVDSPREVISGRNFSVVYDAWDNPGLCDLLRDDPNMYKLRRAGNDKVVS